jgi:predicted Rossmann fold flavoprotein
MNKVVVIGGGPAGMMAAGKAASLGNEVVIIEKNEKLGKKLFITGKGRCNFTNDCDIEELFDNVITNKKFLYSAFYSFSNMDTIAFFNQLGLKEKVERGGRVFPASDKSSDVIKAMEKYLAQNNVEIMLNTKVKDIIISDKKASGVILQNNVEIKADKIILATGGLTYPQTGSTGDGFDFDSTGFR